MNKRPIQERRFFATYKIKNGDPIWKCGNPQCCAMLGSVKWSLGRDKEWVIVLLEGFDRKGDSCCEMRVHPRHPTRSGNYKWYIELCKSYPEGCGYTPEDVLLDYFYNYQGARLPIIDETKSLSEQKHFPPVVLTATQLPKYIICPSCGDSSEIGKIRLD